MRGLIGDPLELIDRLVVLIPPPRIHRHRYHPTHPDSRMYSGIARGFLGAAAFLFMLSAPWAVPPALAGGLVMGLDSQIALGDGIFDLGCNDVEIQPGGLLSGQRGGVTLAGNWINSGTFEPGTSRITFVDGAGVCAGMWTIFGSNDFYDLSVLTSTGKALKLEPGSRQTVAHVGTFEGVLGNPLVVRSTVPGEQAFVVWLPGATAIEQFVAFVDVIVSGHGPTAPAPLLSPLGLLSALLILVLVARWALGRGSTAMRGCRKMQKHPSTSSG